MSWSRNHSFSTGHTEPVNELLVVTESLEQTHGSVGVHVNQSGHHNMVQTINHLLGSVLLSSLLHMIASNQDLYRGRKHIDNESVIDNDGVVLVENILRNNGENPSGINDHTDTLHSFDKGITTSTKVILSQSFLCKRVGDNPSPVFSPCYFHPSPNLYKVGL